MPTWGCDWTWRQGALNAGAVEREGFSYCWLKGGGAIKEGYTFVDPWFLRNAEGLLSTDMVPGVYWYLMPGGTGWQQAALLHGLLKQTSDPDRFMVKLDVEQAGLARDDLFGFVGMWRLLEPNWPLWCYTRKNLWLGQLLGMNLSMLLEEAHWVSDSVANDPAISYASQQYKHIEQAWWEVNYAGWTKANMLQFTGRALVDGKWTPASRFPGTKEDLIRMGCKP